MSRNDLNMEDLFRSQMESFKMDPSAGLWQKVHAKILWKQFFSFSFQTFNVYYLAAALSLAGIGTYAWLSDPGSQDAEQTMQTIEQADTGIPSEPQYEAAEPHPGEQVETLTGDKKEQVYDVETGIAEDDPAGQKETESVADGTLSSEQNPEEAAVPASEASSGIQTVKKSQSIVVRADFSPSQASGCSPLALSFENLSENAVQYSWIFSDGGSSTEKDPSYVFDEPGEYPVLLKITGMDGLEYSTQQTITVFETPKALFEMDDEVDLSSKQPVYFYNYSRGAEYYEWDFGDQQKSELAEPVHYYDNPGSYNVRLKAWTANQCYDSLVILNAFTGTDSEIRFPNAFTPNMTGPTGGNYEVNDISNIVFHPVVSVELIEYQLKIFNRRGLLIFESNDVFTGWDGYYQEKLSGQAVYIWKARGKFSNGKTFVKSGDVTLIRQY